MISFTTPSRCKIVRIRSSAALLLFVLPLAFAIGGNDFGYARTGPLQPSSFPSSISIIVPCFNCAEFVIQSFESFERAFELLHDLTYAKGMPSVQCEVVVVDDKSSDGSPDVVSRFMDPDGAWGSKACSECFHPAPRYTLVLHEENQGAGVTRNDGVAAAQGEVIFFGEADDVFYEHHIPVCWDLLRREPTVGFVKMRMDAGKEYLEASFVAGQVPVQRLHPHWQVAIEDTSPMNLCLRKHVHDFIGGFPGGHLFHMDMEDGAYMMQLFESFAGYKWLSAPSTLYVRRPGNGLDRRMRQFTNEPGTVPLIEQDEKYSDDRMDLIDGSLAAVRDALVEYQAVEELLAADPVAGAGRALHAERSARFGHAYALLRPDFPGAAAGRGLGAPRALVVFRGCRPRALRALLARILYGAQLNPLTATLYLDHYHSQACEELEAVAAMFPLRRQLLPAGLLGSSDALRSAYAVQHAFEAWGAEVGPESAMVVLYEFGAARGDLGEFGQRLEAAAAEGVARAGAGRSASGQAMPEEYAHMWGAGGSQRAGGGPRALSYRSMEGGRVCGEVLRDKSGGRRGGGGGEGEETHRPQRNALGGRLGCWLVHA